MSDFPGKVALLKHIALPVDKKELVCIADLRNEKEVNDAAPTRIVPAPDFLKESCINGRMNRAERTARALGISRH